MIRRDAEAATGRFVSVGFDESEPEGVVRDGYRRDVNGQERISRLNYIIDGYRRMNDLYREMLDYPSDVRAGWSLPITAMAASIDEVLSEALNIDERERPDKISPPYRWHGELESLLKAKPSKIPIRRIGRGSQ